MWATSQIWVVDPRSNVNCDERSAEKFPKDDVEARLGAWADSASEVPARAGSHGVLVGALRRRSRSCRLAPSACRAAAEAFRSAWDGEETDHLEKDQQFIVGSGRRRVMGLWTNREREMMQNVKAGGKGKRPRSTSGMRNQWYFFLFMFIQGLSRLEPLMFSSQFSALVTRNK
ncbi:unnamed protein product [Prorocentrum cordatum]|uniref:Uncharacterized protein n=1 Tax=Prorocentrum cordatum TaxID=2364126 RepID=A0ABN9UCA5_9DINO|nr:unnamed protein product [Polarella glacialis]